MRFLTSLTFLLLITACAKPSVKTPDLDAYDVQQEATQQDLMARGLLEVPDELIATKYEKRVRRAAERIAPATQMLCKEMQIKAGCSFYFKITGAPGINAYADGERIVITKGMVYFAKTEGALAHVLAHEMAHNVMQHVDAKRANVLFGALLGATAEVLAANNGWSSGRGDLVGVGAAIGQDAYSADFEREADYIALYIAERAGFDTSEALTLWRRFGLKEPDGIYISGTHPTYPERFVSMQRTIEEIEHKKARKLALLPEMQAELSPAAGKEHPWP